MRYSLEDWERRGGLRKNELPSFARIRRLLLAINCHEAASAESTALYGK